MNVPLYCWTELEQALELGLICLLIDFVSDGALRRPRRD